MKKLSKQRQTVPAKMHSQLSMFEISPDAVTDILFADNNNNTTELWDTQSTESIGTETEDKPNDLNYSVIVRAPLNIFDDFDEEEPISTDVMDDERGMRKSLSLFGLEENESMTPDSRMRLNFIRTKKSQIFRQKIALSQQDSDIIPKIEEGDDLKFELRNPASNSSSTHPYPQSVGGAVATNENEEPTALEHKFGAQLPRIRGDKSSRVLIPTQQVTNILDNAVVDEQEPPDSLRYAPKHSTNNLIESPTIDGQQQQHQHQQNETASMRSSTSRESDMLQLKIMQKVDNQVSDDIFSDTSTYSKLKTNYKKTRLNRIESYSERPKIRMAKSMEDIIEARGADYVPCRFTVVGSPLSSHSASNNKANKMDIKKSQRTWMFYEPSELVLGLQGLHHSEDSPIWMDLVCDAETFVLITDHVRPIIHGLTIEDCVTPQCREKLEMFSDYLFCCIRTTSVHEESETEKLCVIVFRTLIITYHTGEACDIVVQECRNRLKKRHETLCPSPGWVAHTIIDVIVDRMIPEVECRVQEVQNVENIVFHLGGSSQDELLQRLQRARNWLMAYRSRLWPKSTMTHNFVNADWRTFLGGVQQQYWNDINDHVARMVDLLSLGQTTLESCQNIFIAKISLEMAEQSNQLSDSAGRLTAVGSIFLPLSFFAGLWGMNCKVPFQYEGPGTKGDFTDDHFGFAIVCTMMIATAIITYFFATKYHL